MDPVVQLAAGIVGALVQPLVSEIAAALRGGQSEEEATRVALQKLADSPDLEPVSPKLKALFERAKNNPQP